MPHPKTRVPGPSVMRPASLPFGPRRLTWPQELSRIECFLKPLGRNGQFCGEKQPDITPTLGRYEIPPRMAPRAANPYDAPPIPWLELEAQVQRFLAPLGRSGLKSAP